MRPIGRSVAALGAALCASAACGGGNGAVQDGAGPASAGDPDAPPTMLALPSLDLDVEDMTEHMRFGWQLAEESFEHEVPPAPPSGATVDIQAWADDDLAPWLERKSRTVEAARRELDRAAEEGHLQRILAGALVGLMYEDVAIALRGVPVPSEIQREPEIAEIFRDVLEAQASPFLEHARRAYRACHLNARGGTDTMRRWGRFCAGRKGNLPAPRDSSLQD